MTRIVAEPAVSDPQGAIPAGRVERRRARTRTRLLAAARALFAAQGLEPTTIAEIAERADIAVGSFYNHFATKEDLLAVLLEQALTEQLHALQARQALVSDPAELISVAHRHLVRVAGSDPDWAWLLVRLNLPHRVVGAVFEAPARRDLLAGIEAGRFDVANVELALTASGGALIAVMHAVLSGDAGAQADSAHAEGVLGSFGLDRKEAREIARRPLPGAE
jgi:AcrR family transcriptional regulator